MRLIALRDLSGKTQTIHKGGHEIKELKKLSRDDLKAVHEVKQVFDKAQVKDVKGA